MVAYGTVQGRYLTPESEGVTQVPLAGTVTFLASTPVLVAQDLVTILPVETAVELDDDGSFTVDLVATDDPTTNPTDFTYLVSFRYMHDRDYAFVTYDDFSIKVPANSVIPLTTVSPVPSSPGTPTNPGGGTAGIEYHQALPMATWTVPHSLGRRPSVTTFDPTGQQYDTDVVATSTVVVVTHPAPATGSVVLT